MAVPLPPWLDVKPSDFVGAEEAGARVGLQAQDIATNAALKRAEIGQQAQEAAIRSQAEQQAHALEGQRLSIDAAQQQAALGLKKQELDMEAQKAAAASQAQYQYQQLVSGGMDPVAAALRVGPSLLGESVGGLGSLKRADEASAFTPRGITTPEGIDMVETSPGHWTVPHAPADWQDATRTIDGQEVQGQENTVTGEFRPITGGGQVATSVQKENMILRLQTRRDNLLKNNDRYSEMLDAGDPADPSWSKDQQAAYNSLKKQLGDIDSQISKYSGDTSGASDQGTGTNSTSSGLRFSIVPAQ